MNLLIDFGAIKTGGGVQLATNFLKMLGKQSMDGKVYLLLPSTGPLSTMLLEEYCDGLEYYPNSYLERKLFEITKLGQFIKNNQIDRIYTFFGAGLPRYKGTKSVVSVAYPIICYPDSPYWKYLPYVYSLRKRAVNTLRRMRIRRADAVVVETEVMAERLNKYVRVNKDKIRIIPPSPSLFIQDKEFRQIQNDCPVRMLLLSGLDPHKNLWRLLAIAACLKQLNITNAKFVLSVHKDDYVCNLKHISDADRLLLEEYFEFIGPIPVDEIEAAYENANFLLNLSDLESFSNNYMEAWKSGLPLICAKTDFARHICRDSAVYLDPHNAEQSAAVIKDIISDSQKQERLVEHGKEYLAELPDSEEKFYMINDVVRNV